MGEPRVFITRKDGSVSVGVPAAGVTADEYKKILDALPDTVSSRIGTTDDLPPDRTFRESWTDALEGGQIDEDLARAKSMAHDRRRADRAVKMAPLDAEYSFASTSPARKDAILAEKQIILNDNAAVQVKIDAADNTNGGTTGLRTVLADAGML